MTQSTRNRAGKQAKLTVCIAAVSVSVCDYFTSCFGCLAALRSLLRFSRNC